MADYAGMFGGVQAPSIMNGAMAGLRIPYEMQGADQSLQSSQIQNMSDLDKLKMMQESQDPMNRAKNSLEQNQADAQNNPDLIKSAVQAQLSQNQAKDQANQVQMQSAQRLWAADMSQEIAQRARDNGGKPFDPMKESDRTWWKDSQDKAKKLGIPLPDYPDLQPDGSSKVLQGIVAKGMPIYQNPELYQKLQTIAATASGAMDVEREKAKSAKTVAEIGEDKGIKVANIAADARNYGNSLHYAQNQKVMDVVVKYVDQKKPIPQELADLAADAYVNDKIEKSPDLKLEFLQYGAQGIVGQTMAAQRRKQLQDEWKQNTIYKKGGSIEGETSPSSSSSPAPASSGGGPKAGDIQKGFRFKGGDAADQKNWEKVK